MRIKYPYIKNSIEKLSFGYSNIVLCITIQ